mgnify:CR=1 FL=1
MFFKEINHYGDRGLIIDFGNESSQEISQEINLLFSFVKGLNLPLLNITPSFNKIVLHFNTIENKDKSLDLLKSQIHNFKPSKKSSYQKIWKIPACYDDSFALDIVNIQKLHNISKQDVINLHTNNIYYTYYIGFMPGFPYLGDIDPSLITPRLATPRIQIPARSIGIAKEHTCVYPKVSPGGWNIIGQVPFDIFSLEHSRTSLFLPGDTVQFHSISEKEFLQIHSKHLAFDEIIKEFSK